MKDLAHYGSANPAQARFMDFDPFPIDQLALELPMPSESVFTFYVEGVGIEVKATAKTEKLAYRKAFDSLTESQKNACVILECVDEQAGEAS